MADIQRPVNVLPGNWLDALARQARAGHACVLVTILSVEGSAPRGVGTRMVVSADSQADTIGGGALEYAAIVHAHELLGARATAYTDQSVASTMQAVSDEYPASYSRALTASITQKTFTLGKDLVQCCGGRVTLQFDLMPAVEFRIEVFGAGHIGQELVRLLTRIPCRATFHDQRDDWLQQLPLGNSEFGSIQVNKSGINPGLAVETAPVSTHYVVMTHSHELDFELVEAILARGDARYCGLVASASKAARFRSQLSRKGLTRAELSRLTAPMGAGINTGNTPMEIAIAIASDLLTCQAEAASASRAVSSAKSSIELDAV
ncbi:MAG: XdhC family protein [Granulosicoccus sp.]